MKFFPGIMALALFLWAWSTPAQAQQLDCGPCNNHYGKVQIGTSIQRNIQLKNTGKKTLHIKTKAIKGAAFSFGNFPLPVTLRAGSSVKMPITFTPKVVGTNTGKITLTSDANNPKFTIEVSGVGVAAEPAHLTISPAALNFGNVSVGSSASLTITLSATNAAVTVSSVQSNSSEFTTPGLILPLTVGVGQNVPLTVKFSPNASGTAAAALTLTSNADNSPSTVSLTGVGVAAGPHSADLTWNPSNDPVIGYNVYRGGSKGGPYSQLNGVLDSSTDYTDSTVAGGKTYYYVVKAVNADYQESGPSNEVKVVIPSP